MPKGGEIKQSGKGQKKKRQKENGRKAGSRTPTGMVKGEKDDGKRRGKASTFLSKDNITDESMLTRQDDDPPPSYMILHLATIRSPCFNFLFSSTPVPEGVSSAWETYAPAAAAGVTGRRGPTTSGMRPSQDTTRVSRESRRNGPYGPTGHLQPGAGLK